MATILIVEDSPDDVKLFRTLLTLHGDDVLGLGGGDGPSGTSSTPGPTWY